MDYNKFDAQDQQPDEQGHVVHNVDSAGTNRPDQSYDQQTAYLGHQQYQANQHYYHPPYPTGAPSPMNSKPQHTGAYMSGDPEHRGNTPKGKKRKGARAVALVAGSLAAVLIGGTAGGAVTYSILNPQMEQMSNQISSLKTQIDMKLATPTAAVANPTGSNQPIADANGDYSVAEVAELASPAVVAIGTKSMQETVFGIQTVMAAGSGVIISSDGYIVTNNHVVSGSKETTVTLASGVEHSATIIGTDPTTDLAVIKIDDDVNVPFLTFGNAEDMNVGETVVAIGNPLGEFEGTVTDGVISGKNRNITVEDTPMLGLIQTNAAINSGNSGGALLNLKGEVIGINSAKTSAVGVEGIAFAIPSETVIPTIEQLIEYGQVKRPMLGITGQSVPSNNYGLPQGVMVTAVNEGSASDRAGVQRSDIITAVNGNAVSSVNDINAYKAQMNVGDTMVLDIYRDGQELTLEVVLEEP